jgi:hypothetical protein
MFIFLAVNDYLIYSQLLSISFIETNETPVITKNVLTHKPPGMEGTSESSGGPGGLAVLNLKLAVI